MDYSIELIEFIVWLEKHPDLCQEQFRGTAITEYLRGHYEWYDAILWDMGAECFPDDHDMDTEFTQRLYLLYEMFKSGEIYHRAEYPEKLSLTER